MIGLVLAAALGVDGGSPFVPVVLDVHHGEVFTTSSDGGFDDRPVRLSDATCMDRATTQWVAENKARARAQRDVFSEVLPSAKMISLSFGLGVLLGALVAAALAWQFLR